MKIVSWNCNGSFKTKYEIILNEKADIYVIQECENPENHGDDKYKVLFKNGYWKGDLDYKGVGIFTLNPDIKLEKLEWPGEDKKYFIPVKVNDELNLVAVWTDKPYCEVFHDYFEACQDVIDDKILMIGDFNSNYSQDAHHKKDKTWASCVKLINQKGLVDVYNDITGEEEGKEKVPTFFLHRHLDKPYHFDRCIAAKGRVKDLKILTKHEWLNESDHLPICVEI